MGGREPVSRFARDDILESGGFGKIEISTGIALSAASGDIRVGDVVREEPLQRKTSQDAAS